MPANLEALYLQGLTLMFLFWNSARIFTYVPTILKLLRTGASARDYSLATWGCWVMSNGTFCLYLYEESGRSLNSMVLMNAGNTLMCLVTSFLIFRLQRSDATLQCCDAAVDAAVDTSR
jgi:hypothetical protein